MRNHDVNEMKSGKNKKALCIAIVVLLMIGIAFAAAFIVHRNSSIPASATVKDGLSAYELAVQHGYDGSVEEWLNSLSGKSAYEIAVDNGYTGTEDEWAKSVAATANQNGAAIKTANFSSEGELVITLSDGTAINVGKVAGSDGKNGTNGINGKNGADGKNGVNGINGKDGTNGVDGKNGTNGVDGKDGVGVSSANINDDGQLVLSFSDGTSVNLDKVVGVNGKDGSNGIDGKDGQDGVNGKDGKDGLNGIDGKDGKNGVDGKDGLNGADGVGIETIIINADNELQITLSNDTTLNLGNIKGADGKDGTNGVNGKDGAKGEKGDKGDKGDQGIQGEKGEDGTNGLDGKDGLNGADGKDGKDGLNGKDGVDGKDGTDGQDGIGIADVTINSNGELVLTFSDNQTINLGNIKGEKGDRGDKGDTGEKGQAGANGADGKNGINGTDGADGKNGTDGIDGVGIADVTITDEGALTVTLTNETVLNLGNIKGENGIGVAKVKINADGELIFTYSDGKTENLGKITGTDGADGKDGQNGTGIKTVTLSSGGELIITLTDNSIINLGNVKGEKGEKGDKGDPGEKGADGKDGRGISKTELVNGELIIHYTDGTSDNLGIANFNSPEIQMLNFTRLDDGTLSVAIKKEYKTIVENIVIPSTFNGIPVSTIAKNGFSNCQYLKSVVVPNTVTKFEKEAFGYCKNLEEIKLPENLTSLEYSAFEGCTNLSITIPASVTQITNASGTISTTRLFTKAVYFENPVGWKRYMIYTNNSTFYDNVKEDELKDASNAAEKLQRTFRAKNTSYYYTWICEK